MKVGFTAIFVDNFSICLLEANRVPRILVLTASFGDGHNQAGRAIQEALVSHGARVRVVDYVEWLNPAVRSFAKFSLMQSVKRVPTLYGHFYKRMSRLDPTSSLQKQLNHMGIAKVRRFIGAYRPDAVISTFPTPAGVVSELRSDGVTDVPNLGVLTDYTGHRTWVQPHIDRYFVATDAVRLDMVERGAQRDRIVVSGIPIRSKFDENAALPLIRQRMLLRREAGIDVDATVVLLMGGGLGLLGSTSDWQACMQQTDATFLVVCGRNERLYKRLESLQSNRIQIIGFTEDVPKFMAMADVLVTKPGALTVTESLAMELPMILYRSIPGQEEYNGQYALQTGAAVQAGSIAEAGAFIQYAILHPERLRAMRQAARQQSVRGAAGRIAAYAYDLALAHEHTRKQMDIDIAASASRRVRKR